MEGLRNKIKTLTSFKSLTATILHEKLYEKFAAMVLLGAEPARASVDIEAFLKTLKVEGPEIQVPLYKLKERYGGIMTHVKYEPYLGNNFDVALEYPIILMYELQDKNTIYGLSRKKLSLEYEFISNEPISCRLNNASYYMRPTSRLGYRDSHWNGRDEDMGFMPFFWDDGTTISPTKIEIPKPDILRITIGQSCIDVFLDRLDKKVNSLFDSRDLFEIPDETDANYVYVFRLNYVYDNKETRFSYQNDGDYFHKNITYYMKGIVVRRVKKPTTTSQKMKYSITYPSGTRFAGSAAERSTKSLIEKIVRWQETVNPIENDKDIR